MSNRDISRRAFLQGGLIAGVGVTLAPLGSQAFAALFENQVTVSAQRWMAGNGQVRFRNDALSKVCGNKVFARDIRARDMPGWPQQQGHAMLLKTVRADRIYEGHDLSWLGAELQPDRIVTAADLEKDGIVFPEAHSPDPLLPPGKVPMFIGHPVAILIWNDFERFRRAKLKLKFNDKAIRYGAQAPLYQGDPYGSYRFVRVGGKTPYEDDEFSSLKDSMLFPTILNRKPVWTREPKLHGDLTEQGLFHAKRMAEQLENPPQDWLVFDERYKTPSIEPAALEPDNGNGWYDAASKTLHFVVATQCPFEVAYESVHMIKPSRFALEKLNIHPGYTVGYGSKDNNIFVFYAALAALYGEGVPVRLANDRYEQFQSGIKRHPFDIRYQLAVDRNDLGFRIFRADMSADGGGRANYSASVAAVGATAAQSIYYMPQNDLAVTAYHSRGVEAGSMRGYGTLQTMAATEMMVDEIAGRLGVDAIDLRRRNALRSGMKNTQGAVPAGALRLHEILDKAAAHEVWKDRDARKKRFDAEDPDNWYGVGFAICQKDFGTGAEAPMASIEFSADGRISLRHIGTEIGTGMSTSQAFVVGDFLGRPADEVKTAETEWPELRLTTKGNPYLMSQAEQDAALRDPRWVGKLASPSSATNSAFYFSHATREAARVLFNHGLWPAALALWRSGPFGGQANPYVVRRENAVWVDGQLTGNGLAPIPFTELAKKAHEMGLVTGVSVHGFNRWSWAEADFVIDGVRERLPLDAMAVEVRRRRAGSEEGDDEQRRLPPARPAESGLSGDPAEQRDGHLLQSGGDPGRAEGEQGQRRGAGARPPFLDRVRPGAGAGAGQGPAGGRHRHGYRPCAAGGNAALRGRPCGRGLELQPLPVAAGEGRGGVEPDGGDPPAAVTDRSGQRHRRGGDDPGGRRHRQRRGARHRQARPRPAHHSRPHQGGPPWLTASSR